MAQFETHDTSLQQSDEYVEVEKIEVGDTLTDFQLTTIHDDVIDIPTKGKFTHIQFRRFAGCPVCNLHLHSFFTRSEEIALQGIQEVIIFHASKEKMLSSIVETDFHLVSDPDKELYNIFGLENSYRSLLSLKVMSSAVKGLTLKSFTLPENFESEFIVPADFLLNEKGEVIALHYGKHADDQWSVDELLAHAN